MANIRIVVDGPLMDGHKLTFKAPCDCSDMEYLDVRYMKDNTQVSKLFTMKDANCNALTVTQNLFAKDSYVSVILDTKKGRAYLQNANTNNYIESTFMRSDKIVTERKTMTTSTNGNLWFNLDQSKYVLLSAHVYDGEFIYECRPYVNANGIICARVNKLDSTDAIPEKSLTVTYSYMEI